MYSIRLPLFLFIATIGLVFLHFFALMRLVPLIISAPLLFIAIYLTLYTFINRRTYQNRRKKRH